MPDKDIVESLIAAGADVKAKQIDGNTPLHEAASAGHADVVEVLLAHGADVNERNNRGRTALIMAWNKPEKASEWRTNLPKTGATTE